MGSLGDYLMEELSLKTSFTIPIGGGIPVSQSAVTTWVIMAIVVLLCIIFVRNLKVIPEGPQVYVEALVGFIYNFIGGLVGEKGKRYIPFLGTILIYLGCANISGFFRAKPPTKDLNVTAGLAIISLFLIIYSGMTFRFRTNMMQSNTTIAMITHVVTADCGTGIPPPMGIVKLVLSDSSSIR